MKCEHHPYERGPGVCASCLRARLFALAAAQNHLPVDRSRSRQSEPDRPDRPRPRPVPLPPPPPQLEFPRSVSPYLSHRRSDGSSSSAQAGRDLSRFFSTPQVGPTSGSDRGTRRRSGSGKHSIFSSLFGHRRSEPEEADAGFGSRSWFSGLIRLKRGRRRRKKKEEEEVEEEGWSSGWRLAGPTPARDDARASGHGRRGDGRHVSRFELLLSPFVAVGHRRRRRDVAGGRGWE